MARNIPKGTSAKSVGRSLQRMSGEDKVNLSVDMTSMVTAITIDSIRDRHPGISETKLLELARKRFQSGRRIR